MYYKENINKIKLILRKTYLNNIIQLTDRKPYYYLHYIEWYWARETDQELDVRTEY
jgi:hypothetical protein